MFSMLTNLTKAATAVVLAPVAAVVDVITLPASSLDPHRGAFDRTAKLLDTAGECVKQAIEPDKTP